LTIAAGRPGGRYEAFARKLKERLAVAGGINLKIVETAGSIENLELLGAGGNGADIALVQGGVESDEQREKFATLGSLFLEPVWIFYRVQTDAVDALRDLRGKRVAIGEPRSGAQAVAIPMLEANGIRRDAPETGKLLELGGKDAAIALVKGEADAAFFVVSPESEIVKALFETPGLALLELRQTAAYQARLPALTGVTIGESLIDLETNLPPAELITVAEAANLVVRKDIHPALVPLLIGESQAILLKGGLLERPGQFPSVDLTTFPLAEGAERYYKSGPPFLQRFLPFRVASAVDRLKVMLVPLLTLAIPFFKLVAPTYRWRVRANIYKWYRVLREVDRRIAKQDPTLDAAAEMKRLQGIRETILGVKVPLSYADALYHLHLHFNLVINRLKVIATQQAAALTGSEQQPAPDQEQTQARHTDV
jgi:TRAP-type uncharacterized transport system substrate-binding protein